MTVTCPIHKGVVIVRGVGCPECSAWSAFGAGGGGGEDSERELKRRRILARDKHRGKYEPEVEAVTRPPPPPGVAPGQLSIMGPRPPLRSCMGCSWSAHTNSETCSQCGVPY